MITGIIKGLVAFFSGGIVNKVSTSIIDVAAIAAVLTPVVIWFLGHKDEVALTLTWAQIFFFGLLIAALIKIAHYTRAGRIENRNDFRE